ncbi:MAG: hypothetical protein U1E76_08850 [Planctomycetota bacterium]
MLLVETPYHLRRTPRGSAPGDQFVSCDLDQVARAYRQAIRELWQILRSVGSLGYRRVGLLACWADSSRRLRRRGRRRRRGRPGRAARLPAAPVPPESPIGQARARRWARCGLLRRDIETGLAALSVLVSPSRRPRPAAPRILMALGQHDLIVPASLSQSLADHWRCQVSWYDQGHGPRVPRDRVRAPARRRAGLTLRARAAAKKPRSAGRGRCVER